MNTTTRHGSLWTEGEISSLLYSAKTKVPIRKIANIHKRSEGAILSMLRKIARTYYYRDKLSVKQIQELISLSETAVNAVISEGPKTEKTDYIKKVVPSTTIMEFPITKDRLHNFKVEYDAHLKKQVIDRLTDDWSNKIFYQASKDTTSMLDSFVPAKARQLVINLKNTRLDPTQPYPNSYYLEDLVSRMKERFPDMAISVDPLQTYVLFDWN